MVWTLYQNLNCSKSPQMVMLAVASLMQISASHLFWGGQVVVLPRWKGSDVIGFLAGSQQVPMGNGSGVSVGHYC